MINIPKCYSKVDEIYILLLILVYVDDIILTQNMTRGSISDHRFICVQHTCKLVIFSIVLFFFCHILNTPEHSLISYVAMYLCSVLPETTFFKLVFVILSSHIFCDFICLVGYTLLFKLSSTSFYVE